MRGLFVKCVNFVKLLTINVFDSRLNKISLYYYSKLCIKVETVVKVDFSVLFLEIYGKNCCFRWKILLNFARKLTFFGPVHFFLYGDMGDKWTIIFLDNEFNFTTTYSNTWLQTTLIVFRPKVYIALFMVHPPGNYHQESCRHLPWMNAVKTIEEETLMLKGGIAIEERRATSLKSWNWLKLTRGACNQLERILRFRRKIYSQTWMKSKIWNSFR